jgi:hypothetical protein
VVATLHVESVEQPWEGQARNDDAGGYDFVLLLERRLHTPIIKSKPKEGRSLYNKSAKHIFYYDFFVFLDLTINTSRDLESHSSQHPVVLLV